MYFNDNYSIYWDSKLHLVMLITSTCFDPYKILGKNVKQLLKSYMK